jgi:hypothetical protein
MRDIFFNLAALFVGQSEEIKETVISFLVVLCVKSTSLAVSSFNNSPFSPDM